MLIIKILWNNFTPCCQVQFFACIFLQQRDNGPTYNVIDVWRRNITGAGVVVAVVDEGLDPEHPEIKANYVRPALCQMVWYACLFFNWSFDRPCYW